MTPMLTVNQVAAKLNLHPETVKRMLRKGELRGVKTAGDRGQWRISPSEVKRWSGGE